jgi:hypothetical protein
MENNIDHWYEEDEEVFVHPRDPYHRVDVLKSSRHVKILVDGGDRGGDGSSQDPLRDRSAASLLLPPTRCL